MDKLESFEHETVTQPVTRDELIRLYEVDFNSGLGKSPEENKQFLDKLLGMSERFKNIFVGERGSTYFITEGGQSLNIMGYRGSGLKDKENEVSVTSPYEKIFFVAPGEFSRVRHQALYERDQIEKYIEEGTLPISTVDLTVGSMPVEVMPISSHGESIGKIGEFLISEKPGSIIIATDYDNISAHNQHWGHPVVDIIK